MNEVYIVEVTNRLDGLYVFATPEHRREFLNSLPEGTDFNEHDAPVNGTKGTRALIEAEEDA